MDVRAPQFLPYSRFSEICRKMFLKTDFLLTFQQKIHSNLYFQKHTTLK